MLPLPEGTDRAGSNGLIGAAESFVKKWLSQGEYTLAQRQSVWRDLRYVEIAEAGHMLHHDQPEAVAKVVESFLAEK